MTSSPTQTQIRVIIADDHAILRSGVRMLLNAQADVEVVGEAADGLEAVRLAREIKPDILLLDLSMPGPRSAQTIQDTLRQTPGTRVLVLTMHDDPAYLRSALLAGASGYVVKRAADSELLSAIRAVHRGRTFVDLTRADASGLPGFSSSGSSERPSNPLSPRESQVLALLAQGFTNQEVANRMGVSVKTVETYRSRLGEKLGLRGRAELFRFAVESGLLTHPVPESRP